MKHLILGTAGHIDHGKTALVKALTGIDCDTHKEEKRRGITINLGFAHLLLPNGQTIGVVDVPGHRDFIATMVAGSSGIDLSLLVIAANEGIMPQTREHLQIMGMLGIKHGIIVITKMDMVDKDSLSALGESVREFMKGSFLDNAPLCNVSSASGEGIAQLKAEIAAMAYHVKERPAGEVFRMYIDRIFSISGFGTVVTGSVKSGKLVTGKNVYLLPPGRELRVRRLERFGAEVSEILAGDRASCNVIGLTREDYKRGMLISDRPLQSADMLDVKITLFFNVKPFDIWTHVIFLKDTDETPSRLHLLDRNKLKAGETALAQIHTTVPCVARAGDRFIIRSTSSDDTLGGGEIIDASPLHHRRRTVSLLDGLLKIAEGEFPERVAVEVQKHVHAVSLVDIASALNCGSEEVVQAISGNSNNEILLYGAETSRFLISKNNADVLKHKIREHLEAHHKAHPLEQAGRTREELFGMLGMDRKAGVDGFFLLFLEHLASQGILKKVGHSFALASHSVLLSDEVQRNATVVERLALEYGMQTPLLSDLENKALQKGIKPENLRSILKYLSDTKMLFAIEGAYIHSRIVNECRKKLLAELMKKKEGITVAGFRDLVQGNRKICLLLLAIFDREGVTQRLGDVRVITEKGMVAAG